MIYDMQTLVIGHNEEVTDRFGGKRKCPYCDRQYATQSGMDRHISERHEKEG